jgi:DNA-binding beta-propeller fold protein YncE
MYALWRRSRLGTAAVTVLLSALLLGVGPSAAAADEDDAAGHVYVLNNNLFGANSITTFARAANGRLDQVGVTDIGGQGSLAAFADGTQGSLIRTSDGQRLFAVDAGSNEISVLNVRDGGLSLASRHSSGGDGPVSLTYGDGLLYVLNAANASASAANVTGFQVDEHGGLHPIAGSTRPLSAAHHHGAITRSRRAGW